MMFYYGLYGYWLDLGLGGLLVVMGFVWIVDCLWYAVMLAYLCLGLMCFILWCFSYWFDFLCGDLGF